MTLNTRVAMIAIGAGICAWLASRFSEPFFRRCELRAQALARRPLLSSAVAALTVLLLRAAMLPLLPIPQPSVGDELSYILAADTFAQGRLANPVHPLWQFFETAHVLVRPAYASKYLPGQGLFLAAGQLTMGHPWFGVWLSCGLMAGAVVWAAFGWLPPVWALLAGSLVLPVSILSYWMNSYFGGSVASLGGALVTGAAGRFLLTKAPPGRFTNGVAHAAVFAVGSVLLCWTRPLEGLILITVLAGAVAWKIPRRPSLAAWIVFSFISLCGAAWLGYYNFRVTGNPLRIPEIEYQRKYGNAPLIIFLPFDPPKEIRDPHLQLLLNVWEPDLVRQARTLRGQGFRVKEVGAAATLLAGDHWLFLLPLLLFSPWVAKDRRVRPLVIVLAAAAVVAQVEIAYFNHYAAPFCAATAIVAAQGFRHLRVWRIGSRPVGRFLTRAILALGFVAVVVREGRGWIVKDNRSDPFAFAPGHRARLEQSLPADRRHVIVVRYEEPYQLFSHWVYNHADVDGSPVVWAHDLGPEENKRLLAYYPDRQFWLLRPNQDPTRLEPYR